MAEKSTSSDDTITIKKYANRRLYNTATSSYVTLDHLCQMVKDGQDFVAILLHHLRPDPLDRLQGLRTVRAVGGEALEEAVGGDVEGRTMRGFGAPGAPFPQRLVQGQIRGREGRCGQGGFGLAATAGGGCRRLRFLGVFEPQLPLREGDRPA